MVSNRNYYILLFLYYDLEGININYDLSSKDFFGAMLFLLNKNYLIYLNQKFEKFEFNAIQAFMLLKLSENPDFSQKQLGEYLSLSKGSVAKYLTNLEENDYIKRERFENNKRKYKLILEEKSLEILPELKAISKKWELETWLENFGPDFFNDFKQLLESSEDILKKEDD